MNSTVIELNAINALEKELLRTNRIEPDVNKYDKLPSWDGEIRFYEKDCDFFSKDSLINSIPIQVKGKYSDSFSNGSVSYQVDVADLKNYQKSNGVVFFMVQIKSVDEYRIFYKSLLPFELRRILNELNADQKTKAIKLSRFPQRHIDGISNVFNEFIINRSKQGKLLPELTSISDAKNIGVENFEFAIPSESISSKEEAIDYILSNPIYVYAKLKGISESFATDIITTSIITEKRNEPVVVNGEVLFDCYELINSKKKKPIIHIGNNIVIRFEKKHIVLTINEKGILSELIKCNKFCIAVAKNEDVYIGEKRFEIPNIQIDGKEIKQKNRNLETLINIKKALATLNVHKDLNLSNVDDAEVIKLAHVAKSINEGCTAPVFLEQDSLAGVLTIGNVTLLLKLVKSDRENESYVYDFFKYKGVTFCLEDDKKECRVSPYVVVDKETIMNSDNFNMYDIIESIKSFELNEFYAEKINNFALILLQLYDENYFENNDILSIVLELYEYLELFDTKSDIYHVNRIQTQKRIGSISESDKKYLIEMKLTKLSTDFRVAANILLGSFVEAEFEYKKLSKDEKEQFENFPIINLWKRQ